MAARGHEEGGFPVFHGLLLTLVLTSAPVDVPLTLWTTPSHPDGLSLGGTMGVSFGDFDADGDPDIVAAWSGKLWRNVGGADWELAADLAGLLPPTERRYGASFGDYDADGLPDIALAPRVPAWGDDRLHLLHNVGSLGSGFVDVAADPAVVDVQPYGNAETLCWADVDGDADLDLFVPVYPSPGPGNFFLRNEGGAHFVECSGEAGLDVPAGASRPEGAQFADVDGDGDVDLWSNGTLYRNASTKGQPRFEAMSEVASGLGLRDALDEGGLFLDDDLDGDLDLLVAYSVEGIKLWNNRGDGTFEATPSSVIESPLTGLNLGASAEDWDNDGDVDVTTRQVFRRNRRIEDGARGFKVASTNVPSADRSSATPAWGDWDDDGDLDCALGNWGLEGHFYLNTLYGRSTPPSQRRNVSIRPLRESTSAQGERETEYGAFVEVQPAGAPPFRLRRFAASSHGYLNQNAYPVHVALPASAGTLFDVAVDFPSLPVEGHWRVDRHVNPALGALQLPMLLDRRIDVSRCGRVVVNGQVYEPHPARSPRMDTTAGGLGPPGPEQAMPAPGPAPQPDWVLGLAFDTLALPSPVVVKELVLDGQLDGDVPCAGSTGPNVWIWDVTDAAAPALVHALRGTTTPSNRRTSIPLDVVLAPARRYRLGARVTALRTFPIPGPEAAGSIAVQGGLSFPDANPCTPSGILPVAPDPAAAGVALRYGLLRDASQSDPVGSSLRVSRSGLQWADVGAPAYALLQCAAAGAPCTPVPYATAPLPALDSSASPPPGTTFWYEVRAMNGCGTAFP
jgi:hypothetical protein